MTPWHQTGQKKVCLMTMLILGLAGQSAAQAEEDWLHRSQQILNQLQNREKPSWLDSNPHQIEFQQLAVDSLRNSKHLLEEANTNPKQISKTNADKPFGKTSKPVRLVFISLSIGSSVLKGLFEEASGQKDVVLIFRGPKPDQKLPQLLAELKPLIKGIDPVPNIVIDPTRFQKWAVTTVPEIIVEEQGRATIRVKGVSSLDWVRSQQALGRQGDLGQFGETYAIAEIDLLAEIKQRLAHIDWPKQQQQAIARFWQNRQFEVLPEAQENRDRLIDLTVTAPRDLVGPNGQLIIPAGLTVNPLDKIPFGLCLKVFDGSDKAQFELIRQLSCQDNNTRVLYVATQFNRAAGWEGLKKLETTLKAPVYLLTADVQQRFQLQAVPSLVEQSGQQIVVRERKVFAYGRYQGER
jgi:conjugal transfer pilus assembly protein TraW